MIDSRNITGKEFLEWIHGVKKIESVKWDIVGEPMDAEEVSVLVTADGEQLSIHFGSPKKGELTNEFQQVLLCMIANLVTNSPNFNTCRPLSHPSFLSKNPQISRRASREITEISLPEGGGWRNNLLLDSRRPFHGLCGNHLQAVEEASEEAAYPVPPRRAHDTLQPKDESIIVGYYTLKKCVPRKLTAFMQIQEWRCNANGKK